MNSKAIAKPKLIAIAFIISVCYVLLLSITSIYANVNYDIQLNKAHKQKKNNDPVDFEKINNFLASTKYSTENHLKYHWLLKSVGKETSEPLEKVILLRPNWQLAWIMFAELKEKRGDDTQGAIEAIKIAYQLTPNDLYTLQKYSEVLFNHWDSLTTDDKKSAFNTLDKLKEYKYYLLPKRLLELVPVILRSQKSFNDTENIAVESFLSYLNNKGYRSTIGHSIENDWHDHLRPLLTDLKHLDYLDRTLKKFRAENESK